MNKFFAFIALYYVVISKVDAQQTELFLATQSGSPISPVYNQDIIFWNYSLGIEHYIEEQLSIAGSWRKLFYLSGSKNTQKIKQIGSYTVHYSEVYSSYAIDFESKYFFENTEEGWYLSSGISYFHLTQIVTVNDIEYNGGPYMILPFKVSTYENTSSIFPLSVKLGHRHSGDTFVWDWYAGVSENLGINSIKRPNENYFDFDNTKSLNLIFGLKLGLKI